MSLISMSGPRYSLRNFLQDMVARGQAESDLLLLLRPPCLEHLTLSRTHPRRSFSHSRKPFVTN